MNQELQRIGLELDDWGLHGGEESLEDFKIWVMSHYVVFPFPGSWRDQPTWVRQDFLTLMLVRRWWELNAPLPDVTGLPNIETV